MKPLAPSERPIFTAAACALVGVAPDERIAAEADRHLVKLPGRERALLSLAMRLLEYGGLASAIGPGGPARPRRLTRMDPARREAYLRGWERSRLPPRRQAVASLKALAMLAHYGREDAWAAVGYDGPWLGRLAVEVLPVPGLGARDPLGPGVTHGRRLERDVSLRARVCVIGTGAGGSAAIASLAAEGVDVIAVEAGGHPRAADFSQRAADMLPLLFADAGLRATADRAIAVLQGCGVGGSTLHNTGLVVPPPAGVLDRWRREHGFGWSEEETRDGIERVTSALGASAIAEELINANNARLRAGADALGWRSFIARHNRVSCSGCGYCMLGCAYNRKSNAAHAFLPGAVRAGARVLADARALRIEPAPGGWRVVCRLQDGARTPTGREAVIDAERVVLACGALDTPVLLRRSRLGNRRVGTGVRLHPAAIVGAVFEERVEAWRGLPQSVVVDHFADFLDDGYGGFLFIPFSATPALAAASLPGSGGAHRETMLAYPKLATAAVLLHDETAGRVAPAADAHPRLRYWPHGRDRAELARGIGELARLYLAAGAERVLLPFAGLPPARDEGELEDRMRRARVESHTIALGSVHPQGGCPMGAGPGTGAASGRGELYGAPGLHLCDTSLFPTSVGVPPQVSAMMLGLAVGEEVAGALRAPRSSRGRP